MIENSSEGQIFPVVYLVMVVLLILYAIAGAIFEIKHFHWLHETGLGIILGWLFGGIVYVLAKSQEQRYDFSQKIFFYGLLPPMIFEGGYNLKKTLVFKNFVYIALYGILGTIIAFFVVTGLTFAVNNLGLIRDFENQEEIVKLSTATILIYSATICATDSVAALTMVKSSEYPKLFSIVFGEGMINDAVAIILFRSVTQIFGQGHHEPFTFITAKDITIKFIANLFYSFLIGIGSGVLCAFIFKKASFLSKNIVAEVMLSFFFGLFSYSFAQFCEYSGVIAVFICGITMGHYNFYNLSRNGKVSTGLFFKFISFVSEAFIFVFLGFASWSYIGNQKHNYHWSWTFVLLQLAVCMVARASSIFLLSGIVYKLFMKKSWKVNIYEMSIVWFAGVIRGSVAFALILTLNEDVENPDVKRQVQIIKSSVLFIVFITTIAGGALMPSFIKCNLNRAEAKRQLLQRPTSTQEEALLLEKKKNKKPGFFKTMDDGFFKRWLIRDYEEKKEEMAEEKKFMKLSSKEYQGVRPKKLPSQTQSNFV